MPVIGGSIIANSCLQIDQTLLTHPDYAPIRPIQIQNNEHHYHNQPDHNVGNKRCATPSQTFGIADQSPADHKGDVQQAQHQLGNMPIHLGIAFAEIQETTGLKSERKKAAKKAK
jgi:hypothetical protein